MKKLFDNSFLGAAAALIGAVMMCFGIYKGEMQEVFSKAIRICLECIGIG